MASPKRMGAYNALDDLLPGPSWDDPEPAGERARGTWAAPRRAARRGGNALDELLPGPRGLSDLEEPPPGPDRAPRGRRAGARRGGARRHLAVWNPLEDVPPAPPDPGPARARVSFRLPADLVEAARDAVAHLAGTADRTTLTALAERALRAELARLAATHNGGRPFPPRPA